MLQRAASNAYSWWWASHIRTKQSKWLEHNLQDMEEKVHNVLKLIEEDGDSFAKRAEMYYKKRPELIFFVEESYRAYRALAERYDHLSTELQNANNTIATVFPEKVQFAMEDEYDFSPRGRPPGTEIARSNVPKVPKAPAVMDLKGPLVSSPRKLKNNNDEKQERKSAVVAAPELKSGLSKDEVLKTIDKVQKEILALQTVKEFAKSSYEGGLARYWEIENQITVMQAEVSALQDEFGEGFVIEDDEARRLIAAAALRSCQERLSQLQEKHRDSAEEVLLEQERTKDSWRRFKSLKKEILPGETDGEMTEDAAESEKLSREEGEVREREKEKIKQNVEAEFSGTPLAASKMTEKIDEIVEKVIGLETALASQTALMERLRAENNRLQVQIQALEDDKGSLVNGPEGTMARDKMKEMEEKLHGIRELNKSVNDQSDNLQMHFAETHFNLERLSEKLSYIKPDEEEKITSASTEAAAANEQEHEKYNLHDTSEQKHGDLDKETEASGESLTNSMPSSEAKVSVPTKAATADSSHVNLLPANEGVEENDNPDEVSGISPREQNHGDLKKETEASSESLKSSAISSEVTSHEESSQALRSKEHVSQNENGEIREERVPDALPCSECNTCHCQKKEDTENSGKIDDPSRVEEEPNWRELFTKGMENREKTLLAEYTAVLRNYKEMKKKFNEVERKDEEILSLRRKVSLLQTVLDESKDSKEPNTSDAIGFPDIQLEVPDDLGILVDRQDPTSEIEQKLRMDIDQLLEENLEFWLRFSSTLHQIRKYETAVEDLQAEERKLEEKEKNKDGSHSRASQSSFRSEVRPIYKHLKDIQTELTVWSEKCAHLKDEQQSSSSSLCNIQEEITRALKASAEDDDFQFTSYQAAKFQGEVLNMKQENNQVANELQAGLDHIASLQGKVDRTLARLNEKLGLPGSKNHQSSQLKQAISRNRIPLRSFIFGTEQKKERAPLYLGMSPIFPRREHSTKAGQSDESSQWR